ncbi:MAG: hypothetical protein CMJ47_09480 [Planctomyces sp.]|nr:hypothetical protein [Planctomyces sp.]
MSGRRFVIGIDEAGYGPNIGPLVIGATVWSMPADCSTLDLWNRVEGVVTNAPQRNDGRLHVADSKEVYSSQKGIRSLERSVLSLLRPLGENGEIPGFADLLQLTHGGLPETFARQPWYAEADFPLPLQAVKAETAFKMKEWLTLCEKHDIRLERVGVDIVCPERFNAQVAQFGNKSTLLSRASFLLIRNVWPNVNRANIDSVEVLADKHGGRNRYQEFLGEYFPRYRFELEKESNQESCYRADGASFSFATKSERFLPVALASMTAKYTRELCLKLFNAWWIERMPDLKPTKGYPVDAKRFRNDISPLLAESPELTAVLWRNR